MLPGGNCLKSAPPLPPICPLSPGAMERWEGGSELGEGSMAAWPLAQGSISLDFGFPKPIVPGASGGVVASGLGDGSPCLSQPPPLHTSPHLVPCLLQGLSLL